MIQGSSVSRILVIQYIINGRPFGISFDNTNHAYREEHLMNETKDVGLDVHRATIAERLKQQAA
jgi:hypothetical protein